jgi:hypothetical protein
VISDKEKDRFPFPDQVEERFHGNDRGRRGACPTDEEEIASVVSFPRNDRKYFPGVEQ